MSDQELRRLEAEARYTRERFQLYKATAYGQRSTDPARLHELEESSKRAATRLRRAVTVPESN